MVRDASNNSRLREHRKQRFESILARHSSRLVKLHGDGALVEYSSAAIGSLAADALGLQCALRVSFRGRGPGPFTFPALAL